MEEKNATPVTEVQLGFEFLREAESSSAAPVPHLASSLRASRTSSRPRGLAETLTAVRAALLEAPLSDINVQLLSLFEFCEAALTRTLDVMPTRTDVPFSAEEYRSLRGIGQAQWLLAEAQGKHETKAATSRGKKSKKTRKEEQ